ncbi:hypothetical protein SETIT_8G072700v2 [Setaria italica]|uniref:Uncharacterized protein n=1 Tax=Setaria italica TaxID=4555 RepID=A0A368S6S8_SETIT|nr:hypothetical protein SETIT_8G072700v2 [Setaria italica]
MPLHHTFLHEFLPVLILSLPSPLSIPSMRSCSSRSHAIDDDKVAACSSLIQPAAALAAALPVARSPLAVPSPTPCCLFAISSGTRSCLLHALLPRRHLRWRSPTGGGPRGCLPRVVLPRPHRWSSDFPQHCWLELWLFHVAAEILRYCNRDLKILLYHVANVTIDFFFLVLQYIIFVDVETSDISCYVRLFLCCTGVLRYFNR